MSGDVWNDPEIKAFLARADDELVPMLRESSMTAALYDGPRDDPDVQHALEIGLSIMMGIPIVIICLNGEEPTGKLAQVADHIIKLEPGEFGTPAANERLMRRLQDLAAKEESEE